MEAFNQKRQEKLDKFISNCKITNEAIKKAGEGRFQDNLVTALELLPILGRIGIMLADITNKIIDLKIGCKELLIHYDLKNQRNVEAALTATIDLLEISTNKFIDCNKRLKEEAYLNINKENPELAKVIKESSELLAEVIFKPNN